MEREIRSSFRRLLSIVWRFFAINISIGIIVLGSIVIGAIVFPIKNLISKDGLSVLGARAYVSRASQGYLQLLTFLGLLSYEVKNLDSLKNQKAMVYVANHPSLLDIIFFFALLPRATCIIKSSLYELSSYSFVLRWTNYIVNYKNSDVVSIAIEELKRGNPVVIFPEGTRNSYRKNQSTKGSTSGAKLHRGAVAIALRGQTPLCPVKIKYDPVVLQRGRPWFDAPDRKCEVVLHFGEPIIVSEGKYFNMRRGIAARRITVELERYYDFPEL